MRGFAPTSNDSRHAAYLQQKLLPTYLALPGNRGALLLARSQIDSAEFLVVSLWESVESLETLTGGQEIEEAISPLEAHPDLINSTPIVKHYEVVVFTLAPRSKLMTFKTAAKRTPPLSIETVVKRIIHSSAWRPQPHETRPLPYRHFCFVPAVRRVYRSAIQQDYCAEAKDHVGEAKTICGEVASTRYAAQSKAQPTFLNLDEP
jgi:heme-degrading monooxygenase HmoA